MGISDFQEFQHHLNKKPGARKGRWTVLGFLALAVIAYTWIVANGGDRSNPLIMMVIVSLTVMYVVVPFVQRRSWKRNAIWQKQIEFNATPEHFEMSWGSSSQSKTAWVDVGEIEESPNHIYLWLGKSHAIIVPRRAFASEVEANQLLSMARTAKENSNGA